jgi:hypothetical protein
MSSDRVDAEPPEGHEASGEAVEELPFGTASNRRTFFKGAALGTAAAAMYAGGRMAFGPLAAFANDLSDFPCTAQDIDVGTGVVLNEPCEGCTSTTFCALVRFPVFNCTGANRYCISLHLVNQDGSTTDVLLKTGFTPNPTGCPTLTGTSQVPPKPSGADCSVTQMYGLIPNFPCATQQVCFGKPVPDDFTGKCTAAGIAPCSTIGFSTSTGSANCTAPDQSPPRGQCRHRQICVTGFGITAECADASCTPRDLSSGCCAVPCGGALNVKITASGGTGGGDCTSPLTISVKRPGETSFTNVTLNAGCYVDNSPVVGTYTFRATDCHGCFRETTLAVCVSELHITLDVSGEEACNSGNLTFTASGGRTGCTYNFKVDGTSVQNTTSNTYNYPADPDSTCHTVSVQATCGNCVSDTPSITVSQCVTTTTGCTP